MGYRAGEWNVGAVGANPLFCDATTHWPLLWVPKGSLGQRWGRLAVVWQCSITDFQFWWQAVTCYVRRHQGRGRRNYRLPRAREAGLGCLWAVWWAWLAGGAWLAAHVGWGWRGGGSSFGCVDFVVYTGRE